MSSNEAEVKFTQRMRTATRKIHSISDSLVNAKLLFALNNDKVWGRGLLVFYEIFRILEIIMKETNNENLKKLYMEELNRTEAFEKDLTYYLGEDFIVEYEMHENVEKYIKYLEKLEKKDSDLIMAYVYHLYMGLLSGGQILRKKWAAQKRILKMENRTEAVTDFGDLKISDLKSELKLRMNEIADTLDENKKSLLIEESQKVFELNNSIIKTIPPTQDWTKNVYFQILIGIALGIFIWGYLFL